MWTPIALAAALLVWLPFYIWTEYNWKPRRYVWTKLIASLLFLAVAVSAYLIRKPSADYALWVIAALVLGFIGDVLLAFAAQLKCFILGLVSFLIGQICYGVVFLNRVGFMWVDIILYAAVVGAALFAYTRVHLEFGKMKIPVLAYMLIIAFMFVMAVSTIYKQGFTPFVTGMISAGAALFLASDIVLAFIHFSQKPKKPLRAVNLSLYYTAQLVLALTVAAIA